MWVERNWRQYFCGLIYAHYNRCRIDFTLSCFITNVKHLKYHLPYYALQYLFILLTATVNKGKQTPRTMFYCSVDSDVTEFADGKAFYVFAVDFTSTSLTARQFLNSSIAERESSDSTSSNETTSRNARIHLRQTSENLLDLSHMTIQTPATQTTLRKKGPSTSSDDSGFNDNGPNSPPTYQSLLSRDGSMTKEALLHPSAPFIKRDLWIHPDPVGYGFVIRGTGPCYVKIVDPDSPAGRAGLKASQYIIDINGNSVVELPHAGIEDLILNGPKKLKITIMQPTDTITDKRKHSPPNSNNFLPPTPIKVRSAPLLPSAQPWMKTKENNAYKNVSQAMHRVVT